MTKEDSLPYRRPPLSKHMWWNKDPPDVQKLHYIEEARRKTLVFPFLTDFKKSFSIRTFIIL